MSNIYRDSINNRRKDENSSRKRTNSNELFHLSNM
jgi:hypothetical protein